MDIDKQLTAATCPSNAAGCFCKPSAGYTCERAELAALRAAAVPVTGSREGEAAILAGPVAACRPLLSEADMQELAYLKESLGGPASDTVGRAIRALAAAPVVESRPAVAPELPTEKQLACWQYEAKEEGNPGWCGSAVAALVALVRHHRPAPPAPVASPCVVSR